ncbi:phage baseplate assembly protein V [Haloarcula sp. S1CR25-12]|uniref:Phage baseplate assembly protein V n=1 Tax=Haloarcula saliterrae TaxID=2950534 RepID=A0ABU2FE21_9EURY|nr:phage baseplate assembly protein V [Haloarcula sp. S1CR25-12]MDS0260501.1 phage baseplate assembly protein V [Haloarcula sp. S1CR25-12]
MNHRDFFGGEQASEGGINGVAVGIVTDNEDPQDLGRVKLSFPWRDADDESYWARIATEMAGKQYGTYFLPEVEDEVLVAFENGDIHRPFVIGSLWNGKQKPPQKNSDGNNDIREVRSRSDHKIAFDDADEGSITVQTSAGNEIVIDDSGGSETIRIRDENNDNSITLDSGSGSVEVDANSEIALSADDIAIDGSNSVEINSNGGIYLNSNGQMTFSSSGKFDLNSSGLMNVNATGPLQIKGAIIQLN